MSHHSIESMKDIAFRKGRHGFNSDDDYLRALRGEELEEDESFLDEENESLNDEEDETLDEENEPLDDEEDETSDEEDEDEDEDEDEMVFEFEDTLFKIIAEAPNRMVNALFDWIMKVEAGRNPGALTFAHDGTTVRMSITGEDLVFGAVGNGADNRGQYGFEYFLTDVQDMLMEEESPYCTICDVVKGGLITARQYGYENLWKEDIAKFIADHGKTFTDDRSSLTLQREKLGQGIDTCLRFVRRPLLPDGDTLWVYPSSKDGHPTKLLQWLFKRNGLIDIPSCPEK